MEGVFEDLHNIGTQEEVGVHMCDFDGQQLWRRTEVDVRVGKLKNCKAAVKYKVTGEMIKGGGKRVVHWIWKLCNIAFESGFVSEDWKSAMIVPLYNGKGERTECSNYRGISLLRVVG